MKVTQTLLSKLEERNETGQYNLQCQPDTLMLGKVREKTVSWKVLRRKGSNTLWAGESPAGDKRLSVHRKVEKDDDGPGAHRFQCQATAS